MNLRMKVKRIINPLSIIALSFLIILFLGSLLLFLPISLNEGVEVTYLDSLFSSGGALFVTGIFTLKNSLSETYSIFGITIILILVQIGGLGVMSFFTLFLILLRRKMRIRDHNVIKESFNLSSFKSIRQTFLFIIVATFSFEIIGAILIFFSLYFIHNLELSSAIYLSIFHSISFFNNSGISIFSSSLVSSLGQDYYFLGVTTILVLLGNIGYFVLLDIVFNKFHFKRFSLHTKVTLTYLTFIVLFGTVVFYFLEYFNSQSSLTLVDSFFLSSMSRTTGFTTFDITTLSHGSLILLMIFEFIGGSSGGTAGGIKITTFAVFVVYLRSLINGNGVHLFKRTIRDEIIKKALVLILLGFSLFLVGFTLISCIEGNYIYILNNERVSSFVEGATIYSTFDLSFECMGSFSTGGFTLGSLPYLKDLSKIILLILMYIGRVGPLTISLMFKQSEGKLYRFGSEDLNVG